MDSVIVLRATGLRAIDDPDRASVRRCAQRLLEACPARRGHERELEQRAEAWRPWRAYAAMYLWRMLSVSGSAKKIVSRRAQDKSVASGESFSSDAMVL